MRLFGFIKEKTGFKVDIVRSVLLISSTGAWIAGYSRFALALATFAILHWVFKSLNYQKPSHMIFTKGFFNFLLAASILLIGSLLTIGATGLETDDIFSPQLNKLLPFAALFSASYIFLYLRIWIEFYEGSPEINKMWSSIYIFVITYVAKGFCFAIGGLLAFMIFNYFGLIDMQPKN